MTDRVRPGYQPQGPDKPCGTPPMGGSAVSERRGDPVPDYGASLTIELHVCPRCKWPGAQVYCRHCAPKGKPCSVIECPYPSTTNATMRLYPGGQGGDGPGVLVRVYLCAEHGGDTHPPPPPEQPLPELTARPVKP